MAAVCGPFQLSLQDVRIQVSKAGQNKAKQSKEEQSRAKQSKES